MMDEGTWRDACGEAQRAILEDVASGDLGSALESFKRGDISARDLASEVSDALVRLNAVDYIEGYSNLPDVREVFDEEISERGLEMEPEALSKLIATASFRQYYADFDNSMEDFTERARPLEEDFEELAGTAADEIASDEWDAGERDDLSDGRRDGAAEER